MTVSAVLPVWQSGDPESARKLLGGDAVFSSPVADYRGSDAAHMVGLIAVVLEDIEVLRAWSAAQEVVSAFTARARGHVLDGMLREERDQHGRLVQVTLFLRPYSGLRVAIEAMRELLADRPLPGQPS